MMSEQPTLINPLIAQRLRRATEKPESMSPDLLHREMLWRGWHLDTQPHRWEDGEPRLKALKLQYINGDLHRVTQEWTETPRDFYVRAVKVARQNAI